MELNDRTLNVKIEIPSNKLDKTNFTLTDWGGKNNYAENVYRLSATDKKGAILRLEKTGERTWTVTNGGKGFKLSYLVVSQKESFMGNTIRNHFHPTLLKNYAFLWGNSFLFFPDEKALSDLPVNLQIISHEYSNFYSNFGGKVSSFGELAELFIAAGDYRTFQKSIGGRPIRFLLQGNNWKFSDQQFIDAVSQIIEAQVRYMGFYPASNQLLVTLTEGTPNSHGGTVVKDVISVYPNPQAQIKDFEVLKLISHEHFHFWNSSYLHDAGDKPEGYYKWLSEGFTEYYAGLTLYREGLITDKEYTGWLNDLLLEYQTNPVSLTATADILSESYWKSNDYNRLPYVKGALIALLTDLKIRQTTSGKKQIDDFMRLLMKNTDQVKGFDDNRVATTLDEVTQYNNRKFYDDFILGANFLPVVEVLKNSGFSVTEQQREVFDLGFATASGKLERGVKIKQVFPDSNVFKAGLREGDELRTLSVSFGKPQNEASIGIQRGGETFQFRFFPKKAKNIFQITEQASFSK